jgi:hypothetical protein
MIKLIKKNRRGSRDWNGVSDKDAAAIVNEIEAMVASHPMYLDDIEHRLAKKGVFKPGSGRQGRLFNAIMQYARSIGDPPFAMQSVIRDIVGDDGEIYSDQKDFRIKKGRWGK